MLKGFETSRFYGTIHITGFLMILGICVSTAIASREDEVARMPEATQITIKREIKGFDIADIHREKDDGKVFYEIEAESLDGRRCNIVVTDDGTLLRKNEQIKSEDMPAPIAETIKKLVGDVSFFSIKRTLSPKGEVRYDIQADTKESQIDISLTSDGSVISKNIKPRDKIKINFGDGLISTRKLLLKLRHQIKIVGIGDSRGQHGINPRYFFGEEKQEYPMALNLSVSGAGLKYCKAVIECYLQHVPNLEWVVYGTSPRIFNRYYDNWGDSGIRESHAYRADRLGLGEWEKINTEPVTLSELKSNGDYHIGYDVADRVEKDEYKSQDDKADARDNLSGGRYKFDSLRVNAFEAMIAVLEKRNVKLLAFTPPIHPVSAGQPCTDDDGTTREAYDELVAKMRAFEKKYPNFYFVDINNKGRHKLLGKDFRDMDHLNEQGGKKLTLILADLIKKFDSEKKRTKNASQLVRNE